MKKTLLITLILFILVSSTVCSVNAEADLDSRLNVSHAYDAESQKITIIANFVDITAKEGIIGLEYDVKYDPNVLELVKTEPIYPKRWDTLIGSGAIEDLSGDNGKGVFHWSFVVIALGEGVKNDNELGIRLEFKPLKNESTKVEFLYDDLITEVIENGMTLDLLHVSGSNAKISIDFDAPQTSKPNQSETSKPVVSEPAVSEPVVSEPVVSQPVVSEPVVSEPAVSEPVVSEPVVSEPTVSEPVVSEPEISDPEISQPTFPIPSTSPETTTSDTDASSTPNTSDQFSNNEVITMPSIKVEITDGHNSSVLVDNTEKENDNNWLMWLLIIGGVAIVAIAVVVFAKFRKGNK